MGYDSLNYLFIKQILKFEISNQLDFKFVRKKI
jgi:hypothetical protein